MGLGHECNKRMLTAYELHTEQINNGSLKRIVDGAPMQALMPIGPEL